MDILSDVARLDIIIDKLADLVLQYPEQEIYRTTSSKMKVLKRERLDKLNDTNSQSPS